MLPTIEINEKIDDFVPEERVNPDEKWIKHVHCEWARFHVLTYCLTQSGVKIICSEPDCIYNKE